MRTRISGDKRGPFYSLVANFQNAGHGSSSCNPFGTAYVGTRSTMNDTNNASTFKSGAVVMSACHLVRQSRTAEENPKRELIAKNINGSDAKVTFSGDFAGYFAYGLPNRLEHDMDKAARIALVEAYASMNSSATLSGEQIATMRQTIETIRSPFKAMTKLAMKTRKRIKARKSSILRTYRRDVKRLKVIKAKPIKFAELAQALTLDLEKAVADCWLELRYGMIPLALDCEAHIEYIKQKLQDQQSHNVRRVARSGTRKQMSADSFSGTVWCGLEYVYEPHVSASWSLESRAAAGVIYSVSPRSNLDELNAHLGLRLSDVPSTAWELIPGSFLVDWAVNIGDWLRAIVPSPGIQPLANWQTITNKWTTDINSVRFHTYLGWFTNHYLAVDFPPSHEEIFTYTRTVDNSLPSHPMLIGKPLSKLRVGDAAALAVGKFVSEMKKLLR